jgi:hypothetical protein
MVLLLLASLSAPLQAACPASAWELEQQAEEAVQAYEALELDRFEQLAQDLGHSVPCLSGPISTEGAARVHLVAALDSWTRRDEEQVHAALRALLDLQPGYRPSLILAPEGGGLLAAFELARAAGPGMEEPLTAVEITVDGRASAPFPLDRAAVVQWRSVGPLQSRYSWGGSIEPELRASLGLVEPEPPRHAPRGSHRSRGLALAGAATGLVSLLGARQANTAWAAFHDAETLADAARYYNQNRLWALGSGAAGLGSAGLVVGALVVREW